MADFTLSQSAHLKLETREPWSLASAGVWADRIFSMVVTSLYLADFSYW